MSEAWMQPLQYDLPSPAAKDNSITLAAAAPSNLDAAYNAFRRITSQTCDGSTHIATPDDNNHAAIPLRSATTDSRHA